MAVGGGDVDADLDDGGRDQDADLAAREARASRVAARLAVEAGRARSADGDAVERSARIALALALERAAASTSVARLDQRADHVGLPAVARARRAQRARRPRAGAAAGRTSVRTGAAARRQLVEHREVEVAVQR